MSAAMFADSRARLEWVERLCAQALGLANDFMLRGRARPFFSVDEIVVDDVRFLRLGLPDPPADLGFLVADISTDGKSCLDMAMQEVVDSLGLDWGSPSFPLVYDPDTPSKRQSPAWQVAKGKLPAVIWEAIRGIQPHHPTNAYGSWDVPAYYTGWELQQLTNVNKHRNLTPVIFASSMLAVDDDYLAYASESPWPTEDAVFVLGGPSGMTASEIIKRAQPEAVMELQIRGGQRGGYAFPGVIPEDETPLVLPIGIDDYLDRVPRFIRLALKRLELGMERHQHGSPNISGLPDDWSL